MKPYITGIARDQSQMFPPTLDEYVCEGATVRFIGAFVDSLDLTELGIHHGVVSVTGRPGYHPRDLLALLIYGYLNQIRSSRRLEKESGRNVEVMWLLGGLRPDFKTICRFRSDNVSGFKRVFREFNRACRLLGLFGAELVAIDGSKFKALNSSARHLEAGRIEKDLQLADEKVAHYLEALAQQDEADAALEPAVELSAQELSAQELTSKIEYWHSRREKLNAERQRLQDQGKSELALTDAQSVKLADRKHKKGVVGYNVQVAVDDKAHLIVEIEATTDKNDIGLLGRMASQTQQALEAQVAQSAAVESAVVESAAVESVAAIAPLKVVADAGYHEANQLEQCEGLGIAAYVPKPLTSSGRSSNGVRVYEREAFTYDAQGDWYLCPHQQKLPHRATHRDGEREIKAYYNKSACGGCAFKPSCTQGAFRKIKRRSNEEVIERTAARLQEQPEVFKRRKGLVEHVFGTLRNNGHAEFLMKGKEKISGELHLSALAYNLRRAVNEIGVFALIQAVQIA